MEFIKSFRSKNIVKFSLFLVIIILIAESCQKESSTPSYSFLKSSENLADIPVVNNTTLFTYLSIVYPQSQPIISKCIYNVSLYKITYNTTFKGQPIIASGLVCIPKSSGSFPIISFQNGTNTKNANAPSLNWNNELFSMIEGIASTGYVILLPDYIGFGSSSNILHPYHHRESNNSAVIDLIKASQEFLKGKPSGATGNGKLFLMGYSQGGWATLSALKEIETNPIADEQIQAVSCGSGSYDLVAMTNYLTALDSFPTPLYLPYFAQSHIKNGLMNISLGTIFKEPYATAIPGLFNNQLDATAIDAQLTNKIPGLLTDSLRSGFNTSSLFTALRTELTVNSIPAWNTTSRIFFAAGTGDLDVPSFISQHTYDAFVHMGADTSRVKLALYPGLTHQTALIPWGLATINWFNTIK